MPGLSTTAPAGPLRPPDVPRLNTAPAAGGPLARTTQPAAAAAAGMSKPRRGAPRRVASGRTGSARTAKVSSAGGLGDTVLLLEDRFFRPGGIRVGTLEQMMFRPGLAPDHHSPPPAFRRTTRASIIPYSKGRAYREKIGIEKLAGTTTGTRKLVSGTRKKLVGLMGGTAKDERDVEAAAAARAKKKNNNNRSTRRGRSSATTRTGGASAGGKEEKTDSGSGGRATKLFPGDRDRQLLRSRHNWRRLSIEKAAGTIWGRSACSVPPEDLYN